MYEHRMLIDGKLVGAEGSRTFDNVNPAAEQVLGPVQSAIEREAEELRAELVAEVGCPVITTYGPQLDAPLREALRWPADMIESFPWSRPLPEKDTFGMGLQSAREVWKEPVGVVGVIVPWNFPFDPDAARRYEGTGQPGKRSAPVSETTTQATAEAARRRETFRRSEAPLLHQTGMMSMPVMNPEAPEQFMEWVTGAGQIVKVLFGDPEAGGISLVWSRFGPGYMLPRHSHSADCLYYVTRGELRMGKTVLSEGDGFLQPADRPYTYTAGPDGVEVLEFRTSSSFDMRITESLAGWGRVLDAVRANRERWAAEAEAYT